VDRLKAYDDAFSKFFDRLGHDGINETNTLFVFTVDEGDHFTGDAPSLPDCDGLHTTCDYSRTKNLGYLTVRLSGLLARQAKVTTPFALRQGAVYVNGNPTRTAVETRTLERSMSHLNVMNPLTGHKEQFIGYLADPVEMELLHMITSDSARTPSFMAFPKPDYYLTTDNSQECLRAEADCVKEDRRSNWNHDAIAPEINTIWLGMVGPGVKRLGIDDQVWSDSTDTRPTMLVALGLKDDYSSSGRVLFEVLEDKAVPRSLLAHRETLTQLAQMYKQLNAPVGELGLASLKVSTQALESAAPNDSTYTDLEDKLRAITPKRNDLADKMSGVLEGAAFHDQPINESQARGFIQQGEQLLEQMNSLLVRSNAPS
jgi:hypothetical protein